MNDVTYQLIAGLLDLTLWGGQLVGEENLPCQGPAVFIANHADAIGPIAVACSIPLRMYFWIVGDMVDKERAAAYLQWDLIERQLHLRTPMAGWVARALSQLTVPFLRSLGCIPVYRGNYERMQVTLRLSMEVLRQGHCLLVFPEDNLLPTDPLTKMQPFQRTFVRLGEMYYEATGERLEFYPVAIHPSGFVQVGKGIVHDPLNPTGLERHRLKEVMENTVKMMYLQLEGGEVSGALSLVRK